jgi:hypothetical protein
MASDAQANSRVRENEETFAKANEQIRVSAEQYRFDEAVPFLCECSELTCTDSVRLPLKSYREARAKGDAFILRPGHANPRVERIVAQADGYDLVEKFS